MQRVGVAAAVGGVLVAILGGAARAQVLDVAPDGAVTTLRGPAIYTDPSAPPEPLTPALVPSARPTRGAGGASLADQVRSAAEHNGLSAKVVEAVAWRESRFNSQ